MHFYIYFSAPPQFKLKPPDTVYVKVGESVSLSCEAIGTPPPVISWFKVYALYYFFIHLYKVICLSYSII